MNVYGVDRAHMFGDVERRQLGLFAARVAGTLQVARRLVRDSALITQMDEALDSRTVIDQALGIIMAQQRCTATTAFQLIRRESQNSRAASATSPLTSPNAPPATPRNPAAASTPPELGRPRREDCRKNGADGSTARMGMRSHDDRHTGGRGPTPSADSSW